MERNALQSERPVRSVAVSPEELHDSGLWALLAVAAHFRVHVERSALIHELGLGERKASGADIVRGAPSIGLEARLLTGQALQRLTSLPRAAILRMRDGQYMIAGGQHSAQSHVLYRCGAGPWHPSTDELAQQWSGEMILMTPRAEAAGVQQNAEFGLRWFLPAFWRYRGAFTEILIASLCTQLLALALPILFQVVLDKVLVHKSFSTLILIVLCFVVIGGFEAVLSYLRAYALSYTSSRVNFDLNRRVFAHLLRLPVAYFTRSATGQITARLRETDTIRQFLTGQGLTSVLDILFAMVFILVLLAYSAQLTLVVLASIPVYALTAAIMRPRVRERLKMRFQCYAHNQQFLTESVVGAETIKAAAVEPLVQAQWEQKNAAYCDAAFQVDAIAQVVHSITQYVNKITTAGILYFGANAVMAGTMTIGELIAFNMIAGLLAGPIVRLSQLWEDFQQTQVSVARLGDIMESLPEREPEHRSTRPALQGAISFRDVAFRYAASAPEVLRGINLEIAAGEVIGIVGPSGSGKSTLTKLVQRFYLPHRGQILVDGIDIAQLQPGWLRQHIGVVLQQNLLFNRSIHENIALAAPYATSDELVAAAQLAGAHEFIVKLPQGYDTEIEERGMNLSGGQCQRIALARALVSNPRILILDEATSAVDYESERNIQTSLPEIVRGRTVLIVAHRLATVRHCDRIIGIVDGRIVEDGPHEELLRHKDGLYSRLWSIQNDLYGYR